MSSPVKTIVVFASTGLQGTALIKALSAHNTPDVKYNILALTRSPTSPSATRLALLPGVTVKGVSKDHMDRPSPTFQSLGLEKGQVHGVFSNQAYVSDSVMMAQGKAIADTAKEYGVKHIVYSSVAGEDTGIASWQVKHDVEKYIQSIGLPYTFLRPVQFMDNFLPTSPFMFKMGRTVTMSYTYLNHPSRKHQVIATSDIGLAGAVAFVNGPSWMGGRVDLAGDEMTVKEIDQVFKQELGQPVQQTFGLLARFVKSNIPIVRQQAKYFDNVGTNVDIAKLKVEMPELKTLQTFLRDYKANQ